MKILLWTRAVMKISKKSQGNLLKILRGNLVVFPEQFKILAKAFTTLGEMRLLLSISDLRTSLCSLFMTNVRIKKTMCTVNKKLSNAVYVIPFSVDTKSFVSQIYNLHILTWWLRKEWTKILFPIMSGRSHETKYSKMNQIKFVECSL